MLTDNLLSQLFCPYCGDDLVFEWRHQSKGGTNGIIRCACYRYPVLEDIIFIKQEGLNYSSVVNRMTACLDRGATQSALRECIDIPLDLLGSEWLQRLSRFRVPIARSILNHRRKEAVNALLDPTVSFCDAVKVSQRPSYAEYLALRYANPSFMAAVPLLLLLQHFVRAEGVTRPLVLDIACGVGHSASLLRAVFPELTVIAVDHDPVNLLLAKKLMVDGSVLICLDAEKPLPFKQSSVSGVLCQDALHYVNSKAALVREVERILAPNGLVLFPHLHNATHDVPAPGIPVSSDHYQRLFKGFRGKLLNEARVLETFVREGALDLASVTPAEELRKSPNLSFVGGEMEVIWSKQKELSRLLLRSRERLCINPIFEQQRFGTEFVLRRLWRRADIEAECADAKKYIPEEIRFNANGENPADWISRNKEDELEDLARKFVLVPLPRNYGSVH